MYILYDNRHQINFFFEIHFTVIQQFPTNHRQEMQKFKYFFEIKIGFLEVYFFLPLISLKTRKNDQLSTAK